jgi:hypothetical protein
MKWFKRLALTLLASGVGAVWPTSLVSATRNSVTKANIPGVLAVAANKSRRLVKETLPQATVQGANWVVANPGTAATCGAAGVGLALAAAPGVVAVPALGAAGFGANGVVAGVPPVSLQFLPARYV